MLLASDRGRPGDPGQARRPPAQHAHPRASASRAASQDRRRDPRDLRADRPPSRHRATSRPSSRTWRSSSSTPRTSSDSSVELTQREGAAATAIEEIRATIGGALDEHSIDAEVRGRIKHLYSIWTKLRAPGDRPRSRLRLPRLPDRRRYRPDCYAALGLIHQLWRPVPGPHQGLHRDAQAQRLPVAAHVGDGTGRQPLRGPDPHPATWTRSPTRGIAAHWQYKEGERAGQDAERVAWLRSLVDGHRRTRASSSTRSSSTSTPKRSTRSRPRARSSRSRAARRRSTSPTGSTPK